MSRPTTSYPAARKTETISTPMYPRCPVTKTLIVPSFFSSFRTSYDEFARVERFGLPLRSVTFHAAHRHDPAERFPPKPRTSRLRGEVLHEELDFVLGHGRRQRNEHVRRAEVPF